MPGAALAPCWCLLRLLLRQHQVASAAASSTTPTGTAIATANMAGDSPPEPRQGGTAHRRWWSVCWGLHANCWPAGRDERAFLHFHPCATNKLTVRYPQCNTLESTTNARYFGRRQQHNPDAQYTLSKINTVPRCSCNCWMAPSSSGCSMTHAAATAVARSVPCFWPSFSRQENVTLVYRARACPTA